MLGSYPPGPLHIEAGRFLDTSGREVLLRGVNLGGDCKLPYPNGGTHVPSRFTDHRSVSFIGRPFPLGEADEHFGRLRHWGFNCLRLLTSWEAIEHAGPGQYDTAYLDYFTELCARAGHFGLYVYVQDVDAHYKKVKRFKGITASAPQDTFWGDRMYDVVDRDGHRWSFASRKSTPTPEEMAAAMQQG